MSDERSLTHAAKVNDEVLHDAIGLVFMDTNCEAVPALPPARLTALPSRPAVNVAPFTSTVGTLLSEESFAVAPDVSSKRQNEYSVFGQARSWISEGASTRL